jgi:ATP-dependent Clp endopeptidase proteolytic subunit ClpP
MAKKPAAQTNLFPGNQAPENASEVPAVAIDIIGRIGLEVDAADTRRQITAADPKAPIEVALHSQGGSIFDGYLIHNSLVDHPGPVSVKIMGLAASAGSWIPLAADPGQIRMHKLAQLMIHRGRGGAFDTADGLERHAAMLRKLDDQMAALYAARTGLSAEAIMEMMDAETFMTTEEAKEAGFVDEIVEAPVSESRLDLSDLADVPDAVASLFGIGFEPPTDTDPFAGLAAAVERAADLPASEVPTIDPGLLEEVAAMLEGAPAS